ncbi:MAG: hypothetical protein Q9219_002888 [cf. Caloplaca sp. 3 TL-2023]
MVSFTSLAEDILASAKRLDEHLASNGLPSTSFDKDTLVNLPDDLEAVRNSIIDNSNTMKLLAQGPVAVPMEISFGWVGLFALRAIYSFKIAEAVPLEGSTTYAAIAEKTSISESLVRRILRQAMSSHIFSSPSPGIVAHTASSRLFVTESDFRDAIGLQVDEQGPASARVVDAIRQFGETGEPHHTAFALQYGKSAFELLSSEPERGRRFGSAMRHWTKGSEYGVEHLVRGYDWSLLDHPGATVVDVGGGHGSVSQALAKVTKDTKFIVQDLPGTVAQAQKELPAEFNGRIEFRAHDFFTEQPVPEADVYLFRWILHNWSDQYCVKILRGLVPAMKRKEQRIVLFEYVLSEIPETRLTEKVGTTVDMVMLNGFNGAERTAKQFERLLQEADGRFELERVTKPKGSAMSVVVIAWRG